MENKKFKVKCGQHKDETIKFIELSLQPSNSQITFCDSCLTSTNVKGKFFKIKSIIQNKPIENWPYSGNSLNQSQVNEFKQAIDEIQQNVINKCSEFKNKIIKIIDQYQKQIISSLSDLYVEIESQSQVCDNKIDQFSNLLLNTQTQDDLVQQLRALISSIQLNQNSINLIQSTTQKLNKSKEIPDLVNNTQKDILDTIDQHLKHSIEKINSFFQNKPNNISILEQLKIKPTSFRGGQNNIIIQTNPYDIVVQINAQNGWCQAVSEYIFDKTKKYLIRVQIEENIKNAFPMIGLIRREQANTNYTCTDKLCYYTPTIKGGLEKVLKGGNLFNTYAKDIELFISISENKMAVTDYPNYTNINVLEDNNNNLIQYQNLCLGLSQGYQQNLKYIIKECNIITENPKWMI